MKIAILSESQADETALAILMEAILGHSVEVISRRVRSRGLHSVLHNVPPAVKELNYRRAAEGLVVAVDSDDSLVHHATHVPQDQSDQGCRFCKLQCTIAETVGNLGAIPNQPPIQTAIAVAVPAIESWYLFGIDSNCTEAGWIQRQKTGVSATAEIQNLKRAAYGVDRPGRALLKTKAIEHARRLASNLKDLEDFFPNSFGIFAQQVRDWI